ncbi:MAG: dihydrofolate reductase [Coriobacteriia bacterium]|nr:dihydrofolate reductase [Coriobacteriia bacterium]
MSENEPQVKEAVTFLPNLHAIVAVCDDWGIGKDGDMLVRNREDMRSFVAHTKGHTVLMGRKTLESFPDAKPLVDRRNVVISRDPSYAPEGVEMAHSLEEALELVCGDDEVWVIGGGQVYQALVPLCATAVVTKNHCVREADTFFPDLDADPAWHVSEVAEGGATKAGIEFEFVTYEQSA